jgi:phosphatidylinositol dimannoside acyltransferase
VDLSVGGMRALSMLTRVVPHRAATPLVRLGSSFAARFSPDQRLVVERNLRRVLGPDAADEEVRARAVEVFRAYGRYFLDSLRLRDLRVDQIDRGFTHEGLHHLTEHLDRGQPPILALPHLGGWEWAGAWISQVKGWKVTAVAERLEPPELFEWFLDYRRQIGIDIIALGPKAAAELSAALASGSIITLLCDRDLSGDGVQVEFFGERTTLPGGPALMALRSGSPLLPTAIYFDDDHCHGVVLPPLDTERRGKLRADVERVTQDLALALEELIRRAPEQWHLMQPNWPSDYDALGRERPQWARPEGHGSAGPAVP